MSFVWSKPFRPIQQTVLSQEPVVPVEVHQEVDVPIATNPEAEAIVDAIVEGITQAIHTLRKSEPEPELEHTVQEVAVPEPVEQVMVEEATEEVVAEEEEEVETE